MARQQRQFSGHFKLETVKAVRREARRSNLPRAVNDGFAGVQMAQRLLEKASGIFVG
jgi:hypothetical protein